MGAAAYAQMTMPELASRLSLEVESLAQYTNQRWYFVRVLEHQAEWPVIKLTSSPAHTKFQLTVPISIETLTTDAYETVLYTFMQNAEKMSLECWREITLITESANKRIAEHVNAIENDTLEQEVVDELSRSSKSP